MAMTCRSSRRGSKRMKFVPKDYEVIYIYMYRLAHNPNLQNRKRLRQAPVFMGTSRTARCSTIAPLMLGLFYLLGVHSKFQSDAERPRDG